MPSLMSRIRNMLGISLAPSGEQATSELKNYHSAPDPFGNDLPKGSLSSLTPESGDPGTETWAYIYNSVPQYDAPIPLKQLDMMRFGNGTLQAMLRVLQLPIVATPWSVIPGPQDDSGERATFVQEVLETMDIPMRKVLFEVVQSFWSGFKMCEIVWQERDGKVVVKKLAPRSPHSTMPVIDRHGNLIGTYQESIFMGHDTRIFIPMEKTFWYAHRMNDQNYYGESDLRAAYPHYEALRKLYIIDNKTHEVGAIPVRIAKPNIMGVSDTVKNEVFNKIKKIGLDTAILLPKEIDLEFSEMPPSGSSRKDSIDHHTTQMAMSVLAHFLQLGTNGQGTYNLSADQTDMFMMLETAEMEDIAQAFTQQVIHPLVKLNFDDDITKMPRLEFSDMSDHVRKTVEAIFLAIAQQGNRLSDEFIEALSQRVVTELGLDLNVLERTGENTPKASVDQETLDEQAAKKMEQQAKLAGDAKAAAIGPAAQKQRSGEGAVQARQSAAAKQSKPQNKGTSKANMSVEELMGTATNAREFFNKVKLQLSNEAGIAAPVTPDNYMVLIEGADLEEDGVFLAALARRLVESSIEEE